MKKILPDAPRISVGIPLHRSLRFLDTIITNIEARPKKGVEILISDRHCYDDALTILQERYRGDARFRFFAARDELDWVGNINFLLKEAAGRYWRFLPHDDLSPAGSMEALMQALDSHPEAVLAYGPTRAVDMDGQPLRRFDRLTESIETREWTLGIALEMFWKGYFDGAFKGVVHREALIHNNLFIRNTRDQVFPERCWLFALCLLGSFQFVPTAMYVKRYYPESTHARWEITGRHFHSVAWAMTMYLWRFVKSLPACLYGTVDIWRNARLMARWADLPAHENRPPYRAVPDPYAIRKTPLPYIRNKII